MRLTLFSALALAMVASVLPGCDRTATDAEEAASKGGTAPSQTPKADDRKAPARPASK